MVRYALAQLNVSCQVQQEMALTTVGCAPHVWLSALLISCLFAFSLSAIYLIQDSM